MPVGSRVRANNSFGTTTDNPLTAGATTFNSAALVTLPAIAGGTQHAVVVLDPKRVFGEPEIVVVTVHAAAATVATITRGQYGTVARAHPQGTVWGHVPVDEDYIEILTSGTRPSDPYRGQTIFETDTNSYVGRSTADVWQNVNLFADPPSCRVFSSVAQSIPDAGGGTKLTFNSERVKTVASMHDNVTNNTRITIPVTGWYDIGANLAFAAGNDYSLLEIRLMVNNTFYIAQNAYQHNTISVAPKPLVNTIYRLTATDFVEVQFYQDNTGGATRDTIVIGNYSPEFWACWMGRG